MQEVMYINLFSVEDISLLRFDLQLFAAEDEGRTEDPTEKKIREAHEKGQFAKTQELPQSIVIIFSLLIMFFLGTWIYNSCIRMTMYYMSTFSRFTLTEQSLLRELYRCIEEMAKVLLPVFGGACVAAVLGNVIQVGFQMTTHPLKMDFSKIKFDPSTIIKKIFFSRQVLINLLKSIAKVAAIGLICYIIISNDFDSLLKMADISVGLALQTIAGSALKIIVWSSVFLLLLSIPDYLFQRSEFMESLKMTKEEMKQEVKESMGDPHMRARMKEMQREILMRHMIREVPKADVIVTNPTHFAVALKYERDTMQSPTVLAKGVDSVALKIREIARANNILIVENRPLAQEMYKRLEVGDIIPPDLFSAVAEIYKQVYQLNRFREAI